MAKTLTLGGAARLWVATIGAGALLYYGGQLSDFLIADVHASAAKRWLGVSVAIASLIPWVVIMAIALTALDEYHRRVALVGTAIAFLMELALHIGFNVAMDAQLLSPGSYIPEVGAAILTWLAGVGICMLYYRSRL